MLRYHMVVVTRDNRLKREIKRVTTAAGSTADFVGDVSGFNPERPANLAIHDARTSDPEKPFFAKVPDNARIAFVLEGDTLIEKIGLLQDTRVTSLLCHDARFDEDEFIASATKALRGDVFGLQKYFPWGVTTFSMMVKSGGHKEKAIQVLLRYAKLAGVRGPVRDRIQLVADELMMNALYHAPTDEDGNERYREKSPNELSKIEELPPVQVQYGCSGRYFGISVRDGFGSLSRERALEYLTRARAGAHIENKAGGAGLGLISVLKSCSKLVFNLDHGYSTEVVALFDMDLFAKGKVGARSLHLFNAADEPAGAVDEDEDEDEADEHHDADEEPVVNLRGGNTGKWLLAALLLAVVTAMGTAVYMKNTSAAAAAETAAPPTVSVDTVPPNAVITVNGTTVRGLQPTELREGEKNVVRVTADGYQPWEKTYPAGKRGELHLHVVLQPQEAAEAPRRRGPRRPR